MTRQGPQLTPSGGVHLLRLPGGAPQDGEAPARATSEQLALSPFSGPAPGLIVSTTPVQAGPPAFSETGTVLQPPSSVAPSSDVGDWVLPVAALVLIATVLVWRAIRRSSRSGLSICRRLVRAVVSRQVMAEAAAPQSAGV